MYEVYVCRVEQPTALQTAVLRAIHDSRCTYMLLLLGRMATRERIATIVDGAETYGRGV